MLRTSFLISLILVSFILGCKESDTPTSPVDNDDSLPTLGNQFNLKVGQATTVKPDNITVKFLKVTEDSRCPSDVVCIWAGQVSVVINVTKNGENLGDVTLTLGAGNPELAIRSIADCYIKVLAVNPYPISTRKTEPSEYIATLIVTKI